MGQWYQKPLHSWMLMYTFEFFFQHRPILSALQPCCGEWAFTSITLLKCSGYWVQAMLSADPDPLTLFTLCSLICFLKCPHHLLLTWNLPFFSFGCITTLSSPSPQHHRQYFLCLIFQSLTHKLFHLSGEIVTTIYTRNVCSWWSTGLKVSHILHFNWRNETSICLYQNGVHQRNSHSPVQLTQ